MVKLLLQELAQREEEVLFLQQKAHEDKVSGRKLGQRALADAADVPLFSPLHEDEGGAIQDRIREHVSLAAAGHFIVAKYGVAMSGPLAQIVDVVMYYRRFKHRVDLTAPWRGLKEARRMHRARDRSKAAAAAATVAASGSSAGKGSAAGKRPRSSGARAGSKAASKQPARQRGRGGLVAADAFQEHPGRVRYSRLDKLKQAIALWVPLLPIPPRMRWEFLEDIGALFQLGWRAGAGRASRGAGTTALRWPDAADSVQSAARWALLVN